MSATTSPLVYYGTAALFEIVNISASAGIGMGIGAVTGMISPLHGAVFMAVDTLLHDIIERTVNYFIIQPLELNNEDTVDLAKVITVAISFFASAALSSLILGAFGITITLATALTISALTIAVVMGVCLAILSLIGYLTLLAT